MIAAANVPLLWNEIVQTVVAFAAALSAIAALGMVVINFRRLDQMRHQQTQTHELTQKVARRVGVTDDE